MDQMIAIKVDSLLSSLEEFDRYDMPVHEYYKKRLEDQVKKDIQSTNGE